MKSDELCFLPRGTFPVAGAPDGQTGYWVLVRDVPREELEMGQASRVDNSKPGNGTEYPKKDFPRYERIKVFPQGSHGTDGIEVDRRVVLALGRVPRDCERWSPDAQVLSAPRWLP